MCRPGRWLWGILPLALVLLAGLFLNAAEIENRVEAAAYESLAEVGAGWAQVRMEGRDATLSGFAPSQADIDVATRAIRRAYGVRAVIVPQWRETGLDPWNFKDFELVAVHNEFWLAAAFVIGVATGWLSTRPKPAA
jgi:hypothetical protein